MGCVPVLVVVHLGGGAPGGAGEAGDEEDGGGGTHVVCWKWLKCSSVGKLVVVISRLENGCAVVVVAVDAVQNSVFRRERLDCFILYNGDDLKGPVALHSLERSLTDSIPKP
jgi:hypothetical protein